MLYEVMPSGNMSLMADSSCSPVSSPSSTLAELALGTRGTLDHTSRGSLESLDSGHSSSVGHAPSTSSSDTPEASPSPRPETPTTPTPGGMQHTPTPCDQGTDYPCVTSGSQCNGQNSPKISVSSMGHCGTKRTSLLRSDSNSSRSSLKRCDSNSSRASLKRCDSNNVRASIKRCDSNTSTTSISSVLSTSSRMSTDSDKLPSSIFGIDTNNIGCQDKSTTPTNTLSINDSSTTSGTVITPRKSKEELEATVASLDSLWSQDDEWIMIFDNLIKTTESSATLERTRRHTHHNHHPYNSPYKASYQSIYNRKISLSANNSPYHTCNNAADEGKFIYIICTI